MVVVYECEVIKNLILKLIKVYLKYLEFYCSYLRFGVYGVFMLLVVM